MPVAALKSMAAKRGVSLGRAEHLWDKAKSLASKEYSFGKKSSHHWALVMGIVKKMMGDKKKKNEAFTFKDFLTALNEAENHEKDQL